MTCALTTSAARAFSSSIDSRAGIGYCQML